MAHQAEWEDVTSKDGLSGEDILIGGVIKKSKKCRRKKKKAFQVMSVPVDLQEGSKNQINQPSTQSNANVVNSDPNKEELKKAVKINLRSVTMSSKDGVLLDNLQRDYRNIIGTAIPFEILGYKSLQSFIQSISDVIKLKMNNKGQLVAEAVPDASTSHISSLISRQKSAQKKGKKILQKTIKPPKIKSLPKVTYSQVVLKSKENVKSSVESLSVSCQSGCSSKDVSITPFVPPVTSKEKDLSTKDNKPVLWSGKSLGSFPCIKDNINNAHFSTLLGLHNLIFGVSYMDALKEKILNFGGLLFLKGSEEWKKREFLLSVLPSDGLAEYLNLLCVKYSDTDERHVLLNKLMTFITFVHTEMIDPERKIENKLADSDLYKLCQKQEKKIVEVSLENRNLMLELLKMKNEHKKVLEEKSSQNTANPELQSVTSAKDNIIISQSAEIKNLKSEVEKLKADLSVALKTKKKENGQFECQLNTLKHDRKVEAKNFEKQRMEFVKYISALTTKMELAHKSYAAKITKVEGKLHSYEEILNKVYERSSVLRSKIEDTPSCPKNTILPVINQLLKISNVVHQQTQPQHTLSSSQPNSNQNTNQLS